MHTTTNATPDATFTSFTITIARIATSIITTCKVKGIKMKFSKSIRIYSLKKSKLAIS